jgi:hypothetical protein
MRAPHQSDAATVVAGETPVPYAVELRRQGPGAVEFILVIADRVCGKLPFDNLIKAQVRIDPDHASGPERQVQELRKELSEARAQMYDWQARALMAEERLRAIEIITRSSTCSA